MFEREISQNCFAWNHERRKTRGVTVYYPNTELALSLEVIPRARKTREEWRCQCGSVQGTSRSIVSRGCFRKWRSHFLTGGRFLLIISGSPSRSGVSRHPHNNVRISLGERQQEMELQRSERTLVRPFDFILAVHSHVQTSSACRYRCDHANLNPCK